MLYIGPDYGLLQNIFLEFTRFRQGGLSEKEIQLNLYNMFSVFIFNELYLLA